MSNERPSERPNERASEQINERLYELAKLSAPPLKLDAVAIAARAWVETPGAGGRLIGFWRTEIGELFQLFILREFESRKALEQERLRAQICRSPFNVTDPEITLSMESYLPFPFLPSPEPQLKKPAAFYEFRTYVMKPGGLIPTLAGWEQAIAPAREYTSHLLINMYKLDGRPAITHIWQFASLEERARLRAKHYAEGLWPPKGGPEQIASATSFICIAESPAGGW